MLQESGPIRLESPSGLTALFNSNGSLRRLDCRDVTLNLFVGNELEGGPANLWIRRRNGDAYEVTPLLGPHSRTAFKGQASRVFGGHGELDGLRYSIALVLAEHAPAWFWRVAVESTRDVQEVDLICAQDLALAPYGAIRLNEYYVSQYIDHTPLMHAERGVVIASRQNQAANGRNPWCVIGSLHRGVAFATDAFQVHGLAHRAGEAPPGLATGLPGRRLQHEHSMAAIQDAPVRLERGAQAAFGFFGVFVPDHPAATGAADLLTVDAGLALPEAQPVRARWTPMESPSSATLFTQAPTLHVDDLHEPHFVELFGACRRHEERDEQDRLLSFFYGDDRHVVLRAKECRVQRPHGHLLRTGHDLTPDESALTSTAWMGGVFHSMVTQGHVSINRFLSTVHGYLGLFRSHGQRVFVEIDGAWRLLDTPSAFEMSPSGCRWIYRYAREEIEVRSEARSAPHALALHIAVRSGAALRFLISHHVALDGDDGSVDMAAAWRREGESVAVYPRDSSELRSRFPEGSFLLAPDTGTTFESVGGDELLFIDGRSRRQPYICVITAPARAVGLQLRGRLIAATRDDNRIDEQAMPSGLQHAAMSRLSIASPAESPLACQVKQLRDIAPWFVHDALVHYLSPRGLEQYSGGGWGTRDVCQGPVELLLAHGHTAPVRDLLLRVMRAQNPDGDWPQWFMFFERERAIRAGDSHGDIVFWPILALAQYLLASGDAGVLDVVEPFHAPHRGDAQRASVWEHIRRALAVIDGRVIDGTALAAYGHGDWNDSLQPADAAMREHMCSAWTVTLHCQVLTTLARALRRVQRESEALRLEARVGAVRKDFQRLLLVDGVLAGYALFEQEGVRYLLHPRDDVSGVRYSALGMIHAILEDMLTPEQARQHLRLIEEHLTGPDGVRLFDRPMRYHGGPQRFFQRAESAAFFGREIGLMYMHAHLRYAQALARVGDADRFFHALCQANPIGVCTLVPQATLRQANCYYSSSDAAFADRYEASAEYERVRRGEIALDGGWRVYSSGAGIAIGLIVRRFLGLNQEHDALVIDPVIPAVLSGLSASMIVYGKSVDVHYDVRSPGAGVAAVAVNGVQPKIELEPNPYRQGAARIARTDLLAAMTSDRNVLHITVGR